MQIHVQIKNLMKQFPWKSYKYFTVKAATPLYAKYKSK